MLYVIFDLGTTAIKLSIVSHDGIILCSHTVDVHLSKPKEGYVEFDALSYWDTLCSAVSSMVASLGTGRNQEFSVTISSQAETLVILDVSGEPLCPAISWLDTRAQEEAQMIQTDIGTGDTGLWEMTATWPASKILWIRRHLPDIFSAAATYLMLEDYIMYRLTGFFVGEYTLYSTSGLMSTRDRDWWDRMLEYLQITRDQLTELRPPGSRVGTLRPEAAQQMNVPVQTIAITGVMDQVAGMVGAGNITQEIVTETTGGAFVVCKTLQEMPPRVPPHTSIQCHALEDTFLVISWCAAGGLNYTWLRDLLYSSSHNADLGVNQFRQMDHAAQQADIGCGGLRFYPYIAGPGTFPVGQHAKGCFFGIDLHHGPSHFSRAVLESIAYLLRMTLEGEGMGQTEVSEIRVMGGGSKSDFWNTMKADVTGVPVKTLKTTEAPTIGSAIIAAVSCGQFSSIAEGVSQWVTLDKEFLPNPERHQRYSDVYHDFCRKEQIIYRQDL